MLNIDILNGIRPRVLHYGSAGDAYNGSNLDCNGVAIPTVDESALPCDGLIISTDCITTTKAYNFFGIGVGEYLTSVFTKITDKVKLISNLVNINTKAIADEIARATLTESNLDFAIGVEETSRINADALKANIASPTFTGIPNSTTAAIGTNTTQIATTAFVTNAISSAGGVTTTKVSLTTAQIKTLGTTRRVLLSAPGVGKTYDVLSVMIKTNFNTTPFNSSLDDLHIRYSTANTSLYNSANFINQTGSYILYPDLGYSNANNAQITVNDDLEIYNLSNATLGDGSMDIYITYKIITL